MSPRVPVSGRCHHGQTLAMVVRRAPADARDPGTYGRSFADVYDDWYADAFDTPAAVRALHRLAAGDPILELGVGTGRLAIPLASSGLRVVGIDSSAEMLEQLDHNDPETSVTTVLGDMSNISDALRTAGLTDRFGLVFCAFNTMLNLGDIDAVRRCLEQSRENLRPNGRIVIEAFVPVEVEDIPSRSLTPARVRSDAAVFIETTFDRANSRLDGRHVEVRAGEVSVRPWSVLLCGPAELDLAAQGAGLSLLERWSDWTGAPFDDLSSAHISIYGPDPSI